MHFPDGWIVCSSNEGWLLWPHALMIRGGEQGVKGMRCRSDDFWLRIFRLEQTTGPRDVLPSDGLVT